MDNTQAKVAEVLGELHEWFKSPNAMGFYHDAPLDQLRQTLAGPKLPKSLLVDMKLLRTWYGHKFVYDALTGAEADDRQSDATGIAFYTAAIASIFAQGYPKNPPRLQFSELTYWLALCLNAKWYDQAGHLTKAINRELDTAFLHGGEHFNKASWFIVRVANSGFQLTIDYTKYKYPKNMGVYNAALEAWDTTDLAAVDRIVTDLCDYHLSQADFSEEKFHEFSFVDEYVHAYEILCWLSVRARRHLPNPGTYSHPLMALPVNRLPLASLPFKKFDLGEQVLSRLQAEFPQATGLC